MLNNVLLSDNTTIPNFFVLQAKTDVLRTIFPSNYNERTISMVRVVEKGIFSMATGQINYYQTILNSLVEDQSIFMILHEYHLFCREEQANM